MKGRRKGVVREGGREEEEEEEEQRVRGEERVRVGERTWEQ